MNEDLFFLFSDQDILLPEASAFAARVGADSTQPALASSFAEDLTALGRRDFEWEGRRYAALSLDEEGAAAALGRGLLRLPMRQAMGSFEAAAMRPALKALALLNWLETSRHCGACGKELVDDLSDGPDGIGRRCPACGRMHFPRISPAIIALVRNGPKVLLAHNSRFPQGRFGLIAGFVEAGETLEEAAVREIREEAGIEVRELRYRKSQPWPFPDSLMIAFTAEWAAGEPRPDGVEITELRWCSSDELPNIPPPGSVARFLIDEFAAESR